MSAIHPSRAPLAVLIARDGYEEVWAVTDPPPPVLYMAVKPTASLQGPTDVQSPLPERRFVLEPHLRVPSHRWWRVYNHGRSCTPEDGYVYLEAK